MKRLRLSRPGAKAFLILPLLVAVLYGAWRGYRSTVGDPRVLLFDEWHAGTRILDREGRLLRELPGPSGNRGRPTSLTQMGDRLVLATIVSEDRGFYEHDGVDPVAVARATTENVTHGRLVSGASTITQQLVKLLDHEGRPHSRGLREKFVEAARAQNLEDEVSKDTILEAYLNRLSYGHGWVGPEAAAEGYFGVSSKNLSWAQAAYLAVLPRAPSFLDPVTHPERVQVRQAALLAALHSEGLLDEDDYRRARAEEVTVKPVSRPFLAPHFVEKIRSESGVDSAKEVVTTLDLDLQRETEGLVSTHLASIRDEGAENAAVVVVENATGNILAYVGSANFHNEEIDGQVNMIEQRRQPGSALKPFFYELAFERGHNGSEMLPDVPTAFGDRGSRAYAPLNFYGTFDGPVSAREALAGSLNVPVVRLLAEMGPETGLKRLHELGFASLDKDASYYGLPMALGSGEVTLRELAVAYTTLARGGEMTALRMRKSDPPAAPKRVMETSTAASITEILSDPLARVRGLGTVSALDTGFAAAVKTGTSAGYRDAVCAGYTRERTVIVWVGNADGKPTRGLTGARGAGPLFTDVLRIAMRDVSSPAQLYDKGLLEDVEVCPLSGKRPGPACPDGVHRKFAHGHAPDQTCQVHAKGSRLAGFGSEVGWRCDPKGNHTMVLLPDVYAEWLFHKKPGAPGLDPHGFPWFLRSKVAGCNASSPSDAALLVRVTSPAPGEIFLTSNRSNGTPKAIEVRAAVVDNETAAPLSVDFWLDGKVVARSKWPYSARIQPEPGEHELVALPTDPNIPARIERSRFVVW
ncbi:MAG: penicillin-binding protein 1C [Polyangiaceae bacterium]|nr:penicillin-binding protein 1C [Polyangiaceae bacterium]